MSTSYCHTGSTERVIISGRVIANTVQSRETPAVRLARTRSARFPRGRETRETRSLFRGQERQFATGGGPLFMWSRKSRNSPRGARQYHRAKRRKTPPFRHPGG